MLHPALSLPQEVLFEFVPDEVAKTVRIEFFKVMIAARNPTDLTACLAGQPEINYETARQLKLSSKSSISLGGREVPDGAGGTGTADFWASMEPPDE